MSRFSVIPAVYLLLLRGEADGLEVLLQLRGPATSYLPGHWASAAAGHVEQGESVYAATVREAGEELGILVDPGDLHPLCTMQRTLPGVTDPVEQRVDFFLTARHWVGNPSIREPDKCVELGWFSPAALPVPMVPHEHYLLARVPSGRVPALLTFGYDDGARP